MVNLHSKMAKSKPKPTKPKPKKDRQVLLLSTTHILNNFVLLLTIFVYTLLFTTGSILEHMSLPELVISKPIHAH